MDQHVGWAGLANSGRRGGLATWPVLIIHGGKSSALPRAPVRLYS